MTDYTPIDCGLYSEYEQSILQRRQVQFSWREAGGQTHVEVLRPLDLQTRDHEEYLVAEDAGGTRLELRLDRIITSRVM